MTCTIPASLADTVSSSFTTSDLSFSVPETRVSSPQAQPADSTGLERRYSVVSNGIEFNFDESLSSSHTPNASSDSAQKLTPAQRRRKAQNRAAYVPTSILSQPYITQSKHGIIVLCERLHVRLVAFVFRSVCIVANIHSQRALRDRKRQRVQTLEDQVTELSIKSSALQTQNEWLKQQLVMSRTEIQLLKTQTTQSNGALAFSDLGGCFQGHQRNDGEPDHLCGCLGGSAWRSPRTLDLQCSGSAQTYDYPNTATGLASTCSTKLDSQACLWSIDLTNGSRYEP